MSITCKPFLVLLADALKNNYGIKGNTSKVVCIKGGCEIGEVEENKYLCITVKAG